MNLEEIREAIPSGFPCKDRCFKCCGPVPIPEEEWKRIMATPEGRRAIKRFEGTLNITEVYEGVFLPLHPWGVCPFLGKDGCLVYDERPLICRAYGQLDDLECGEGVECPPELRVSSELKHEIFRAWGTDEETIELYEKVYGGRFEV